MLYRVLAAICAVLLMLSGWAQAQTPDVGGDSLDAPYPVVITPTRLRQSLADVPASITIITAETIRRYGITNLQDALRLVPGMAVSKATGNRFRINYHGADSINPRRMNVLIDGVSVYRPSFSTVEWSLLPVVLEDIDRIEVIRGTNSAAYGPNSMTAVVNILTKHPKDVERALVAVSVGSHHTLETTVRLATTVGAANVRATVNTQRDSGYDELSLPTGGHDSTNLKRLNLRLQNDLSDGSSLDLQASYVRGLREVSQIANGRQTSYPDQHHLDTQFSGKWIKALSGNHEIQIEAFSSVARAQQTWSTCWPQFYYLRELYALNRANPYYVNQLVDGNPVPTGGSASDDLLAAQALAAIQGLGQAAMASVCGQANQNLTDTRRQIELQDTLVVSDALRLVVGLGLRYQTGDSQTYLGGKVGNRLRWAFGHAEYRPAPWVTTNVGGYVEYNSLSGDTFSPRAALNIHLSESQTIRAVVSRGNHSPDILEERARWSYTITDLSTPVQGSSTGRLFFSAYANGGFVSERVLSRELGYLATVRQLGLTFDAKVFDDRLSHMISNQLTPVTGQIFNDGVLRLSGVEAQANWDLARNWSGLMSYGYLLNRGPSSPAYVTQTSKHIGAIGLSHALGNAWRVSLAHVASSGNPVNEPRYARSDLTVTHGFNWGTMPGSVAWVLAYQDNPYVRTILDTIGDFTASDHSRLNLRATVRLAF